ncbi:related to SRB8 - DNA-directed RNA polymerase II holoenzyme and Srb10 CDK subcomplex subunit [Cephalotrichum gorgonifer]|uniref:Mediator of RNA polymerase II transcription subunit 12 n=1 Tax=Cephalotrichum gorgonifer TaxID=2041049 RepID=A0AAE8MTW6_9PEZI|nr:related to SRB8 - DNA-directed RNA polymerase II holoenzyme and Srb10 CDK subcomplex subunit [Cephalotrichum gorgonifer]
MTSRTPIGVQPPRPPQRTLGSPSLPGQRPSHQRTLSQQYLPQSPIRKESSTDPSYDLSDAAQPRYHTAPRRGGSRLKLELSTDSMADSTPCESPQPLSQPRITPLNDSVDTVQPSPSSSIRQLQPEQDNIPLPMPKRRARFSRAPSRPRPNPKSAPPSAVPAKARDNRPKPYTVEYPQAAPRYHPSKPDASRSSTDLSRASHSGYADFFPWSGTHPEDQFSETVIRNGYFHKAPPNQAEAATAKPSMPTLAKQKSCLNALSSVFLGVLAQRRHGGQISSPSTFKPPPRVTLTDTKREMWLKDLANPATSLRRLSRTIPHGIRGKVLLDHCLNKNVPTERAVWLAKCVGANDLRAFRRKGVSQTFMGGETKWIRDWTLFVEQFVESVFSAFDMPDWKSKVTYAIRLATNLYTEQLLDRDHYMEWLLSGVENSTQDKLPMWILVLQLYWKDLLRLRKTGRRLVTSLLNHLSAIQADPDRDLLLQLSSRLKSLLTSLLTTNPESFISPTTWWRCREALVDGVTSADLSIQAACSHIDRRNSRLVAGNDVSSTESMHQRLVKLLDSTICQPFNEALISQCWALGSDKSAIVQVLLDWSTSPLRPGLAKVYVAVRLLRSWGRSGLDVTASLLDYLDLVPLDDDQRKHLLYHLISELARSGDFSTARYLQWVISRGGLSDAAEVDPRGPCASRLLVELPTHTMNPSLRCMRANLLRRASFDVEAERVDLENAIKLIKRGLGLPLALDDPISQRKPMSAAKLAKPISRSSRALQASVGAFLKDEVFGALDYNAELPEISCATFNFCRAILEAAGDCEMLLAIVKLMIKSSNPDLLASCADTISLQFTTFAAVDDMRNIFDALLESLKTISQHQGIISARALLASLADLADMVPGLQGRSEQLRGELLQCDRSSAIDACSPVSDSMTSHRQDFEGTIYEEIEKMLTSGNRIDQPTMGRLFKTIAGRLEDGWSKSADVQRTCLPLLTRLRAFDYHHFDAKMGEWVGQVKSATVRPPLVETLPLLVGHGCLSLATVLNACLQTSSRSDAVPSDAPPYSQEMIQLASMRLPPSTILTPEECCRFYIQQKALTREQAGGLRRLLSMALREYCDCGGKIGVSNLPLDQPGCWQAVLDLFNHLVLVDPTLLAQALAPKDVSPAFRELVERLTSQALGLGDGAESQVPFDSILEMANELSLPFCQVKLSLTLTDDTRSPGDNQSESHLALFTKAMENAIDTRNVMWTSILPHLGDGIAQHLKNEAQAQFIELFPSMKTQPAAEPTLASSLQAANSLLSVIESISRGHAEPKVQLLPAMGEKLSDMWDILAGGDDERKRLRGVVLTSWLPLMLRFVAMHAVTTSSPEPVSTPTPTPNSSTAARTSPNTAQTDLRAKILLSLAGILLELEDLDPTDAQLAQRCDLSQQVFDLALVLVDYLPEDARAHCARLVLSADAPNPSSDPRLRYLFSYMPPSSDNLMLSPRNRMISLLGGSTRMAMLGSSAPAPEKLVPFGYKRWEVLNEPTPNVGENDTSLSMTLFEAIKLR